MKKTYFLLVIAILYLVSGCDCPSSNDENDDTKNHIGLADYYDNTGRDDVLSGGVKMIPIQTPKGEFKVWTKRTGNNPDIKILILHGGPGASHQYLECFDSFFPGEGFKYYYYDQLGSARSDQPGDSSLWQLDRFVEEVEQVRIALGLDSTNFYLFGQSWGGILGIEYALKYQQNLKALVISNMVSSGPDYVKYAQEVLGPQLDPEAFSRIKSYEAARDYKNPEYLQLIEKHYYPEHLLRMPMDEWPEPVVRDFKQTNFELYTCMQGPSEFGMAGNPRLKNWDRSGDLHKIHVPTLTMGAAYDTMDPEHMEWMASQVQNGRYEHCLEGSHLAMYDAQEVYFEALIRFIKDIKRLSNP